MGSLCQGAANKLSSYAQRQQPCSSKRLLLRSLAKQHALLCTGSPPVHSTALTMREVLISFACMHAC